MFKKLISTFLLLGILMPLLVAQDSSASGRSEVTETINGKLYYLHQVKPKETLYGLCKAYEISKEELFRENPAARDGLKPEQLLRIPKKSRGGVVNFSFREVEVDANQNEAPANGFLFHTVSKGETIYAIAKHYGISEKALKNANFGLGNGLKPEQVIRIPSARLKAQLRLEEKQQTYTVRQGETLWSIAKKTGLRQAQIVELNPDAARGLNTGQVLQMPADAHLPVRLNVIDNSTRGDSVTFLKHRVKRKETLAGIATRYNVKVEDILFYNPKINSRGFKKRMLLKIPVFHKRAEAVVEEIVEEEIPLEETELPVELPCGDGMAASQMYRVGLMLPLYLEEADSLILDDNGRPLMVGEPSKSMKFLPFYEGAMLAIDSLRDVGLNARLYVYDVDANPAKVKAAINQQEFSQLDLIIGPLFNKSFKQVAAAAAPYNIPVINPYSTRNTILNIGNRVYKIQPSKSVQFDQMITFLEQRYPDARYYIYRQNNWQKQQESAMIKNRLTRDLPTKVKYSNLLLHNLVVEKALADSTLAEGELPWNINIEGVSVPTRIIEEHLSDSTQVENPVHEVVYLRDSLNPLARTGTIYRKNVVIALPDDKVFAQELLTSLSHLKDTFDIVVVGMPKWKAYDLETQYLHDMHVHLFGADFIDYKDVHVERFLFDYRKRYGTEPSRDSYAFDGYDLTFYFVKALMSYGSDFDRCLDLFPWQGLKNQFEFVPKQNGFENRGFGIYTFQNYQKKRLD